MAVSGPGDVPSATQNELTAARALMAAGVTCSGKGATIPSTGSAAKALGQLHHLVLGADIAGFRKVADAMIE